MLDFRRTALGLFLTGILATGCNGAIGGHESTTGSGSGPGTVGGGGPTKVDPGKVTVPPTPITATVAFAAVRKAKNLLTGLAPTDDEVATVTKSGAAGMQQLVATWMTTDPFQTLVASKMVGFFRNMFQQTGFVPTEDFKMQLLQNGGFDFGGNTRSVGGDAFPRLVQNIQDSFAMTAWQLVKEGHPFTETLTTNRYVMTTGLKSVYVQIDMPADAPTFRSTMPTPTWTIDYSGNAIPLETALSTMTFSDEPVPGSTTSTTQTTCRGGATVATGTLYGTSLLFQRLLGHVPQFPSTGTSMCAAEAANPYLTTQDLSDWAWVTIKHKADATDRTAAVQPYDLPSLRQATELTLSLPRVGFYTTPAYLALWNTNDSNQHRVTANQTLLVALGQAFTAENTIVPFSSAGLDSGHAVAGSECVGCHATLDPMRNFWANQFDFNDRNDFPGPATRGAPTNTRPTSIVDEFAFGDFRATSSSINDLGSYLAQVSDGGGLPRFGIAVVQQLCFFANSAPCSETDTEFRRVVASFRDSSFNYAALMKEFFASPLVTGAVATGSYDAGAVPISVARRDHFCAALANRLGKPDVCALAVPVPSSTQTATARIAASIAADAFSRGAQSPVTPSDPTLFYSSATEMLCENIAPQVVDAASGGLWASTDVAGAIAGMVETIMGYPPSHPLHDQAVQILTDHNTAVVAASTSKSTATKATNALRSTFVLACESPTAVGIGL
jgi:hypothetical protein